MKLFLLDFSSMTEKEVYLIFVPRNHERNLNFINKPVLSQQMLAIDYEGSTVAQFCY